MLMDWFSVNRGSGLEMARSLSAPDGAAFCYLSSNVSRAWHRGWYPDSPRREVGICLLNRGKSSCTFTALMGQKLAHR